jgi:hypothetical protein
VAPKTSRAAARTSTTPRDLRLDPTIQRIIAGGLLRRHFRWMLAWRRARANMTPSSHHIARGRHPGRCAGSTNSLEYQLRPMILPPRPQ